MPVRRKCLSGFLNVKIIGAFRRSKSRETRKNAQVVFCVLGLGGILQSAPVDWLVKTCIMMYNLWDVYLLNWILCLHIIYTWLSCFIYILCTENLLGRLQQMMVPVPVSFALWIDESNGKYQWDWPLLLIFLYTVGTQTDERSRRYSAVGRPRLEESNRIACWSHWLHPHRDFCIAIIPIMIINMIHIVCL